MKMSLVDRILATSHITLDIETLGRSPTSPITQIAAVQFSPTTGEIIDSFERKISYKSLQKYGFIPEYAAIYWWITECSKDAQINVYGGKDKDKTDIRKALIDFKVWSNSKENSIFWTHPEFDASIIRYAGYKTGINDHILYYRDVKCMRTLDYLLGIPNMDVEKESMISHDALEDCKFQALKISRQFGSISSIT